MTGRSRADDEWIREPKFDVHSHIYPLPDLPLGLGRVRAKARRWLTPWTRLSQVLFTELRHVPLPLRKLVEQTSFGYVAGHLLLESTVRDRIEESARANISESLIVAHPPLISNEFVSKICASHPQWIPAWQFEGKSDVHSFTRRMQAAGVRALKIHPMADGKGPEDSDYLALLAAAEENDWVVLLHSGVIWSNVGFKNPRLGEIETFLPWLARFPKVKFVVAHMNIHEPEKLLKVQPWPTNLWLTLSWQNEDSMRAAIRKVGAERLLFASDWPLLGDNGSVQARRLARAMDQSGLPPADQKKIWRGNALALFARGRTS